MGNDYRNGDEMSNAVVPLRAGNKVAGIIPTNVEEVFRIAKAVAASGLAPRGMNTPEQITVAIMHGAELGLPPMQSIQRIAVVNGRPTVWGDAIPALLWSAGFKLREWMDGEVAWCEVTRPGGDKIARSFSEKDARKAGLWGKAGPWTQYPDRMKAMRARGFASRDGAPDVLGGLYLREEVELEDTATEVIDNGPPRRSAHAVRKSGDYERFEADIRDCVFCDQIDAAMERWKPLLATMPDGHQANAHAFAEAIKMRLTNPTLADPEPDAPIVDVEGFLAKLEEDRSLCNSVEEVAEVAEANADMIARLSPTDRLRAAKILTVEE